VADDSETITTLLETALVAGGYEVTVARNGPDTYEKGKTEKLDLVILDHLMPGLLGLEIIEKWRAEGIETPVIVLSGVDDDRTVVQSLEIGAVDFVHKPFRLNELMARIKQRISG
jgi:DNA-binding response OmpR family regulator